jgi:hypothetical protein
LSRLDPASVAAVRNHSEEKRTVDLCMTAPFV